MFAFHWPAPGEALWRAEVYASFLLRWKPRFSLPISNLTPAS